MLIIYPFSVSEGFCIKNIFFKKKVALKFQFEHLKKEVWMTMIDIGLMPVMSEAPPLALDGSLSS